MIVFDRMYIKALINEAIDEIVRAKKAKEHVNVDAMAKALTKKITDSLKDDDD